MKRTLLLAVMLGCGGGGGAPAAENTTPTPADSDPFAADADWRFKVERHAFGAEGAAVEVTPEEDVTCELRASTLDCTGDVAFFEGVWTRDAAGYSRDGKALAGAQDGDVWCASETREDPAGSWSTTICLAADGIDHATRSQTEPAGNGYELRFERVR